MTRHTYKPGDIARQRHGMGRTIANEDGELVYANGAEVMRHHLSFYEPTGFRAIPTEVCERVAATLRDPAIDYGVGQSMIYPFHEWADILDPQQTPDPVATPDSDTTFVDPIEWHDDVLAVAAEMRFAVRQEVAGWETIEKWADRIETASPKPEPEYVQLRTMNGGVWEPTAAEVADRRKWAGAVKDPAMSAQFIAMLNLIDDQLDEGKELRP